MCRTKQIFKSSQCGWSRSTCSSVENRTSVMEITWPGAACSQQLHPCLGPDLQATGHALPRLVAFMLQELTAAQGCMCHPTAFCTAPCAPKGVEQLLKLVTRGMTESALAQCRLTGGCVPPSVMPVWQSVTQEHGVTVVRRAQYRLFCSHDLTNRTNLV